MKFEDVVLAKEWGRQSAQSASKAATNCSFEEVICSKGGDDKKIELLPQDLDRESVRRKIEDAEDWISLTTPSPSIDDLIHECKLRLKGLEKQYISLRNLNWELGCELVKKESSDDISRPLWERVLEKKRGETKDGRWRKMLEEIRQIL
jgi:hypothetical protein